MARQLALDPQWEAVHRAPQIANREVLQPLRSRAHPPMQYDEQYDKYLRAAGLLGFSTIVQQFIPTYNGPALTALVDRWRPETHTFHLPCGEMTITLQDVAMILALPIKGEPVCGAIQSGGWRDMVEGLIGRRPEPPASGAKETKTSGVSIAWLEAHFQDLPEDADSSTIQQHARAYILHLFGTVLFPDAGGDMASWMFLPLLRDWAEAGTYSWGSAALAWLYRQLCNACSRQGRTSNLSGCLFLLQIWMWTRLPVGRPSWHMKAPNWEHEEPDKLPSVACLWANAPPPHGRKGNQYMIYTNEIDALHPKQVEWTPYEKADVLELNLNFICKRDEDAWCMRCPLVCFYAVEFHLAHRVLRQFGRRQQHPPAPVSTSWDLHQLDRRRTKKVDDWLDHHRCHVNSFKQYALNNVLPDEPHSPAAFSAYLRWFHHNYRVKLSRAWSNQDILEEDSDDENLNNYDARTREGWYVEPGPVSDRMALELHRIIDDASKTLSVPHGAPNAELILRLFAERVRTRCCKMAARLGFRATFEDVMQPPQPSISASHGGHSSSHTMEQSTSRGSKMPANNSSNNGEYEEEDHDSDEQEEIGVSQMLDAPIEEGHSQVPQVGRRRPVDRYVDPTNIISCERRHVRPMHNISRADALGHRRKD